METSPLFAVEDSDSEVFDGTSPSDHTLLAASVTGRTNSSSSSRKSSYEDLVGVADSVVKHPSSVLDHHPSVPIETLMTTPISDSSIPPSHAKVEWKPEEVGCGDSPHQAQNGYGQGSSSDGVGGGESPSVPPQEDLKALYGSAVTVTIDPPRDDNNGGNDEVINYLEGGRPVGGSRGGSETPQAQGVGEGEGVSTKPPSLSELFDAESSEERENFDLFRELDDVDLSEEDDGEPPPPTKICLLSKYVYTHINPLPTII